MAQDKSYFVVEFRYPFEIKGSHAKSPETAVEEARKLFEQAYGFYPDKWNARIFEFSVGEGKVGAQAEYFFSPTGLQMKEINKNILSHQERIENDSNGGNLSPSEREEG